MLPLIVGRYRYPWTRTTAQGRIETADPRQGTGPFRRTAACAPAAAKRQQLPHSGHCSAPVQVSQEGDGVDADPTARPLPRSGTAITASRRRCFRHNVEPMERAAVAAYNGERARDRMPLDWASTPDNLGNALAKLRRAGERDGASQSGGCRL